MERNNRLESLDALRGFDMLFIIGLASLIVAVCNALGQNGCWLATQMTHVDWNGFRHHDTIFPLFLFIAGVSFPYSVEHHRGHIYRKIFSRTLILILLGLICNGLLQFDFAHLRFYSVLGRIGLAWMGAALLYVNFSRKTRIWIAATLLVAYWVVLMVWGLFNGGLDPLSYEGNLVGYIDRKLFPGHLYRATFDPEGLLSTVPAIVTAMLGNFTGEFVKNSKKSGNSKTIGMLLAALALLGAGLLWSIWFPVNKKLWSSSFVLVVGAFSLASFALFYWIIDVKKWRKWAFPLKVVGMNSIAIFMLPRIISIKYASDFLFGGFISLFRENWQPVAYWAIHLLIAWLLLYFLYRKKIFLKV